MRRKKIVKKGFRLCLMVCGHSGAGKSTFINTLCDGEVYSENNEGDLPATMDITTRSVGTYACCLGLQLISDLSEPDGTTITLSVVDTPGFGNGIDNSKW